ncbi:MAG TPA: carbamoyltransferase HypF, partial [Acidobacteriaceae bacterium]|nr:carbamoyltransferase HypF [Acidobacteriaceae bacterium]
ARAGPFGPTILRRARGYAPAAVAVLPVERPILAVGADLKNSVTLVVDGQAFVSQHIGDLEHYAAFRAFKETIEDLVSMYEVSWSDLLVVRDCHPQYLSAMHALALPGAENIAVQHHRAHAASALAERGEWERTVAAVSFDGAGYGDDGSIWGGEIFAGSVRDGLERVAHLRGASLAGGDAAAHFPVQAAAGFLDQLDELPDLTAAPFRFGSRYHDAVQLLSHKLRSFPTTSAGRLFDTAAALLGFVRETSFEGQAAIWLEQLARGAPAADAYPFPLDGQDLDFRPLLAGVLRDRIRGRSLDEIARAFHLGVAAGVSEALREICSRRAIDTVVLSGGVFQNQLLLEDMQSLLRGIEIWTNHAVPPNDGGISLGQAAIASLGADSLDRNAAEGRSDA